MISKLLCIKSRAINIAMLSYILRFSVSAALSCLVNSRTFANRLVIVFLYPSGLLTF